MKTEVNFEESFTVDKDDNVTTLNTDKTVTIAYTGTFTCANSLYIFACNTGGKAVNVNWSGFAMLLLIV